MSRWSILIALIGCLMCLGCRKAASTPAASTSPSTIAAPVESSAEADRSIEAILAGKDEDGDKAVPVEEFFAKLGQGYMLWKGEVEWFQQLADEAKSAGSPAVYAVVSEAFGATHVCASYIIAMPADPAARPKVIEAYNNFWKRGLVGLDNEEERKMVEEDIQSELVQDHGQKYLMLNYDP